LDIFGAAVAELARRTGPLELVLPTVPHLQARVGASVAGWPVKPRVIVDPAEKWAAFRAARAALAASGTVTLELALAGVPLVGAYRVPMIEEIVARLAGLHNRLKSVILANLVIGENVVPEFLQRDCTPQKLADALVPLLNDTPERSRQTQAFARLDAIMTLNEPPSTKAADIVLELARKGRSAQGSGLS
jgi:lipid-A-disaccharide synthase